MPSGFIASTSRAGVVGRHDADPAARRAQAAQDAALDAEVVGDHVVALGRRLGGARPPRPSGPATPARSIRSRRRRSPRAPGRGPPATGACARARPRRAASSTARVMTARCAPDRRMRRVTARVSMPDDAGDAVVGQQRMQRARRAPVRDQRRQLAHDEARAPGPRRLEVDRVDADVADLGRRHGDDLAAVRRVGQHLLVAGDRGVEHDLARRRRRPRRSRSRGRRCRPPWRAAREAAVRSASWLTSVVLPSRRLYRRRRSARRGHATSCPERRVARARAQRGRVARSRRPPGR